MLADSKIPPIMSVNQWTPDMSLPITIKATNTMELNALNKVKITNTVETLGLILSDLIQVITGLRTVGNDTLNNDTQNALNAVKARVISLLE